MKYSKEEMEKLVEKGWVPFVPTHILKEAASGLLYLGLVILVAVFYVGESPIPADPLSTPAHIKPEWYFLAAYQGLKLIPGKFLGIAAQMLAVTFVILLPFFDRSELRNPKKRPLFTAISIVCVLIFIALSVWGKYS